MIISLLIDSINNIGPFEQNITEDEESAWLYLIERLKTKGMLSDLLQVTPDINDKSRHVARRIRYAFEDEQDKNIVTMI